MFLKCKFLFIMFFVLYCMVPLAYGDDKIPATASCVENGLNLSLEFDPEAGCEGTTITGGGCSFKIPPLKYEEYAMVIDEGNPDGRWGYVQVRCALSGDVVRLRSSSGIWCGYDGVGYPDLW